jgi:multidrug resistance efflux pump
MIEFSVRGAATWAPFGLAVIGLVMLTRTELSGPVAPGEVEVVRVLVSAPVDGRVESSTLALGGDVAEGALAFELSAPQLDRELETARLELARLELEVPAKQKDLILGERSTLQDLEREAAEARLQEKRFVADLERERASVAQIDEQIARQRELIEKKLASSQGLEELLLKRSSVAESVDERRALVEAARKLAETAEKSLAESRRAKPSTSEANDERLAPLAAAVRAQRERVAALEDMRATLKVHSPVAGAVLELYAHKGDRVAAGTPLAVLVDTRPRRVIAYADEMWARDVTVGARAQLAPSDRRGGVRSGRVVALAAAVTELPERFRLIPTEPAFGRAVFVELDDASVDPPLPGQAFDVTFQTGARGDVAATDGAGK